MSNHQAHPRPLLALVLQAQTPQTQAYNSYPLGNNKQTVQTVHKHKTLHHSRLSHVTSPKVKPRSRLGKPTSLERACNVTSLATPPRAPEAVRLLQPNAPQPLTLLRPFILGGLLPVGIEPPT